MPASVESFCNDMARARVVSADEVRSLYGRWKKRAGVGDLGAFQRWLVADNILTEYQIAVISRGHGEQLHLDQYKLLDRIGRGRMAGVYEAVHAIGTTVAIKILPPSKAKEPETLARFRREARLTSKLRHPNVVRSFHAGAYNGLHYLVMEHLEGETLKEVLERRKRLPPGEAARLMQQALLGLEHIHRKGLVHRDLEPGNLMLLGGEPDSTLTATVKILDIGLGRALFDEDLPTEGPEGYLVTAPGTLLGTPDYMAPEQARDSHAADVRSDIYSLGCVFYHCLTGQTPFPDNNRVRVLVRHATEKARPVQELNPSVPDGLQQILDWMMAKDPAQRYPTPERAAKALETFLAAGSDVVRLEHLPRMREYLEWLDQSIPDDEGAETLQTQAPAKPRAPEKAPPRKPPPLPAAKPEREPDLTASSRTLDLDENEVLFGMSSRDFLMLAIGVAAIGVIALVIGILYLLSRGQRNKNENDGEKKE